MAKQSTPEESARAILSIFKDKGVQAGQVLLAAQVSVLFLTHYGSAAEYSEGLNYCAKYNWLEAPHVNQIMLTDAGFAEL